MMMTEGTVEPTRRRDRHAAHFFVLIAYLAVSLAIWWHVWAGGHPSSTLTCGCGDTVQEAWFLNWLPWAIRHGHNPFLINLLFAHQGGVNALDNTTYLLPGALLSPITVIFGPIASANVDDLKQHVRDNLANYKVPREIIVLDELPRSSTGKISRRDLHSHIGPSSP